MFGWKKNPPRRTEGGKALMAQMGLVTSIDDMVMGQPNDDDDLEAELRALEGEDINDNLGRNKKKDKLKSPVELEKLIAMSMKDVASDEEVSDTEDPELMAELEGLMTDEEDDDSKLSLPRGSTKTSPPTSSSSLLQLLQDRVNNYQSAISNSKVVGDSSKLRRYERGLKTLDDLVKQAKMGKQVAEEDIPPLVAPPLKSLQSPLQPVVKPENSSTGTAVFVGQTGSVTMTNSSDGASSHNPSAQLIHTVQLEPIQRPSQPLPRTIVAETATSPNKSPSKNTDIYPKPNHNQIPSPYSPTKAQNSLQSGSSQMSKLMDQREIYKSEALKMKRSGNKEKAVEYLKISKQLDSAIRATEEGQHVDMDKLPPFLSSQSPSSGHLSNVTRDLKQGSSPVSTPTAPESMPEDKPGGPPQAVSLEALHSRMMKYKEAEEQARSESNSSKARRMGRIIKQHEEAIKMYKKGQPYDYSELPSIGFPPFQKTNASLPAEPSPSPVAKSGASSPKKPRPPAPAKISPGGPPVQHQVSLAHSRAEQQASFLEHRQMQFKKAALQAKASGDLQLAKKYLKMAKGFDQMIEASKSGLPVNLSQIPKPPGDESDFVFVQASDIPSEISGDSQEVYKKLQNDLLSQIKLSEANRDMFTKLGDISSANKFEKLRESSMKDLEALKNAFEHGDPVPRFHYETRQFSIVRCCPDLGDNDLEVTVMRGLNFNPPAGYTVADLHTYVKFEFPFPDTPQTGDTPVIKGSDSPEFYHTSKLEVNRKSRSFLRLLKSSKALKFDVYYRRGFLKSDKLLGTVAIKLQPLEDKCVYHECYDLMEGRKAVGGKLEVKIRIRDPFVNKQVDETKEKWLVIDDFIRKTPQPQPPPQKSQPKPSSSNTRGAVPSTAPYKSLLVLKYEKELLDEEIEKHKNRLSPSNVEALKQKSLMLQKSAEVIVTQLQTGGTKALQDYVLKLKMMSRTYAAEAANQASHNATDKIKITVIKKALVDKEIESLSRKLQAK